MGMREEFYSIETVEDFNMFFSKNKECVMDEDMKNHFHNLLLKLCPTACEPIGNHYEYSRKEPPTE